MRDNNSSLKNLEEELKNINLNVNELDSCFGIKIDYTAANRPRTMPLV